MLFRSNPTAGLKKAEQALAISETKIEELQAARHLALLEADTVESVAGFDSQIAKERAAADVHRDRIAALKAAVRAAQAEQMEAQRRAALTEVQKRLDQQVELAKEVEAVVKQLGEKWAALLQWRTSILGGWPDSLPRPPADAFVDVRAIQRELATTLYSAGRPSWDRQCSIPAPAAPIGVQGLEPKGLANAIAAAGAGFLARIKSTRIQTNDDEEAAA